MGTEVGARRTVRPDAGREEIIAALVAEGAPWDRATVYADAFLEYREATANILQHGLITLHPRTNNPITNPYLAVRDIALKKLAGMRSVKAEFLWAAIDA